jgi:hypothetical protein
LGVTLDGELVVIELKRDRAPRETVAQAIDYASWVASLKETDIFGIAQRYLKGSLGEAFQNRFGQSLPDLQLTAPRILVVASRLDASTERMIQYLSRQFNMRIDGLVFRHIKLPSGEELVIRTTVVAEEPVTPTSESDELILIEQVRQRGALPILQELRKLNQFLVEEANPRTYGGSLRYWAWDPSWRMLCGVNAASNWGAPTGTIDVWVSHGHWAQVTGLEEAKLTASLRSDFEFVKQYERSHQMILRIKSLEEALKFVNLLRSWRPASWEEELGG